MIKFIDVTGKTEDEAIQSALAQLKMDRDDVSVEILERAKAGFLGIGSAPARVRVSYDDGKAEEVKPAARTARPAPSARSVPPRSPSPLSTSAKSATTRRASRSARSSRAFLSTWTPPLRSRSTRVRRAATRSSSKVKSSAR